MIENDLTEGNLIDRLRQVPMAQRADLVSLMLMLFKRVDAEFDEREFMEACGLVWPGDFVSMQDIGVDAKCRQCSWRLLHCSRD